jgi:hypothetical protein
MIDLNNPSFQKDLFALDKNDQLALIRALKKISQLSWNELYKDQGLKWELIISKTTKNNDRIYSFRHPVTVDSFFWQLVPFLFLQLSLCLFWSMI